MQPINTPQNTHYNYAGFWIRFAAMLVDNIAYALILAPIMYAVYGEEYFTSEQTFMGTLDFLLSFVLPVAITIWMWQKFTATPGKMLFKLQVLDEQTGTPITMSQAIIRYLGYMVSALVLCLGFIWVGFDKKKQGWHDKMAKTVVVKPL